MWNRLDHDEINRTVEQALSENTSFRNDYLLGIPASHLDSRVFYDDAPFLAEAPYLRTLIANPNHIGCHTLGESEKYFKGTHKLERDLIKLCAEDILNAQSNSIDGYVAAGGTEANMQAVWIYRNYFMNEHGAHLDEIAILCTSDTHYAVNKASNLMCTDLIKVDVVEDSRAIDLDDLKKKLAQAKSNGIKYLIVFCNMATTMFGSVDDIDTYASNLSEFSFKIHVDGAYGGFIYPFSNPKTKLSFRNPLVSSVTLDAHKLAQAPYGTGIFLCRKNLMENVATKEAEYVQGNDITIVGSRSGANPVAVWMILKTYGYDGWKAKVNELIQKTNFLCKRLDELNVQYYRNKYLNIVTIKSEELTIELINKYNLVPDNHENPNWLKIVAMDHVKMEHIEDFLKDLASIRIGEYV